ncbi:hypothetical protein GCM10007973_00440 [Polymorphobacter multimanifer]|uniref:M23 family metallopeptidase n=1 Tax=Polymorphobacter multimanifer TaxID=1070431 RepID=UPI00166D5F30|nr:M23 family metallopeptidase [Polymorphobacter multimanifer]GGI67209.1 hypothetical protein GCM10007973_00440 [Polymorphobacter multimanifer]
MAGWLGIATTSMISGNSADETALAAKQQELVKLERALAAARSEAQFVKGDVAQRADLLEARQEFLTALLSGKQDSKALAALLPRSASATASADVQAMMPPLVVVESQQLALVDKATGAAEARIRDTQALIRRLGLDPRRFTAASDWKGAAPAQGMGGPFVPATTGDVEPRFKDLFLSWRKLETMQASLASIPALVPVKNYRGSSGYGRRFDPFNGRLDMHAGTDMSGSHGEPIFASANGRVARTGSMNGYGIMAEIDHGKGIETRYGHMSKVLVKPGQMVRQGDLIGRMGSTGRSTGTHLHYEVRVDGSPVDPKPFLEAASFVLAVQGEAERAQQGPALEDRTLTADTTPAAGGMMMTPIRIAG